MPANKNQIRRIQTILKMMRQNRYPNYTSFVKEMRSLDVAGTYKLSGKTFQRDIADLRDEYGAPIHYDASRKGFYLSNTDRCTQIAHEPLRKIATLSPSCVIPVISRSRLPIIKSTWIMLSFTPSSLSCS